MFYVTYRHIYLWTRLEENLISQPTVKILYFALAPPYSTSCGNTENAPLKSKAFSSYILPFKNSNNNIIFLLYNSIRYWSGDSLAVLNALVKH